MMKEKQPTVTHYDFRTDGQVPVRVTLTQNGFKLTVEVLAGERCLSLDEVYPEEIGTAPIGSNGSKRRTRRF